MAALAGLFGSAAGGTAAAGGASAAGGSAAGGAAGGITPGAMGGMMNTKASSAKKDMSQEWEKWATPDQKYKDVSDWASIPQVQSMMMNSKSLSQQQNQPNIAPEIPLGGAQGQYLRSLLY